MKYPGIQFSRRFWNAAEYLRKYEEMRFTCKNEAKAEI
jgi:hypothetical protein